MRSLGCQHTDVVFNIKHTVADGTSNGNANWPFRNNSTSPVYLTCIIFLKVSTTFLFKKEKKKKKKKKKERKKRGFSCCLFPSLAWRYVFGRSLSSLFSLFCQIFAGPHLRWVGGSTVACTYASLLRGRSLKDGWRRICPMSMAPSSLRSPSKIGHLFAWPIPKSSSTLALQL